MFKEEYKTLLENVKIRWFSFIEDTLVVHLKWYAFKKQQRNRARIWPSLGKCLWMDMYGNV